MKFSLERANEILTRTPSILSMWLSELSNDWLFSNEGPDTFSAFDIVGHLVHGEKTDWVERTKIILEHGTSLPFDPYDRFAQKKESEGKNIEELLEEFTTLRFKNLGWLASLGITEKDLDTTGMHPSLGEVTLRNLLSTWVVHDLTHLAQIGRVMSKQYKDEMGPWPQYFRILSF